MPLLAVGDGTSVSLALMAHDKGSPNIVYQQMLWPAISAELDTDLLLTLIQLAEKEVLRDEGEAYARELTTPARI
jgi:hypothetical protein